MLQLITGPFGRIAYHDTRARSEVAYPVMNIPCDAFARAEGVVAANSPSAPGVVQIARYARTPALASAEDSPALRGQ